VFLVVVVIIIIINVMSSSGSAYMGRQMCQRDKEFCQIHVVIKYIFDVNTVTKMMQAFRCPLWA